MKTLNILVVTDGVPGHESQALGLCQWLSSRYHINSVRYEVRLRFKALSRIALPFLQGLRTPAGFLFKIFYTANPLPENKPDVIVSMGGNTSFANILLSHYYGCTNIFIGSLRRLNAELIAAHLTLEPTGHAANIVMQITPSTVDREKLLVEGKVFIREIGLQEDKKYWTLIIGGDGAGYHYSEQDWIALGTWANSIAEQHNIRWLISTSRRTGANAELLLKATINPENIATAIWWNHKPEKKLMAMMGVCERIIVTADSMSMINEAIASGCDVVILDKDNSANGRYRNALQGFVDAKLCSRQLLSAKAEISKSINPPTLINELVSPVLDALETILERTVTQ